MNKIEIIVECEFNDKNKYFLNRYGKIISELPFINSYLVEIDKVNLEKINKFYKFNSLHFESTINAYMDIARHTVNADKINDIGLNGKAITSVVLDTGIAPLNDFVLPANRIIAFKDFINNKKEPYDDNGHGTHISCSITNLILIYNTV